MNYTHLMDRHINILKHYVRQIYGEQMQSFEIYKIHAIMKSDSLKIIVYFTGSKFYYKITDFYEDVIYSEYCDYKKLHEILEEINVR